MFGNQRSGILGLAPPLPQGVPTPTFGLDHGRRPSTGGRRGVQPVAGPGFAARLPELAITADNARVYLLNFFHLPVPWLDATGAMQPERLWPRVHVRIYMNNGEADRVANYHAFQGIQAVMRRAARGHHGAAAFEIPRAHLRSVSRTMVGKGTLAQIRLTLGYALTAGGLTAGSRHPEGSTPENLQAFCDSRRIAGVGVDCSGFINGYLASCRGFALPEDLGSWTHGSNCATLNSFRDLRVDDILHLIGHRHVMIVSKVINDHEVEVCESNGTYGAAVTPGERNGGLFVSVYQLLDPALHQAPGTFRVRRAARVETVLPGSGPARSSDVTVRLLRPLRTARTTGMTHGLRFGGDE